MFYFTVLQSDSSLRLLSASQLYHDLPHPEN